MSFEPVTMEPSGVTIAGWNGATFDTANQVGFVQFNVVEPITAYWDFTSLPNFDFLTPESLADVFTLAADPVPETLMDIDSGAECGYGRTSILGGVLLGECGVAESLNGGILFAQCGITFNEGVFPPTPTPPVPPPERCPPLAACPVEPELQYLQEVSE